MPTFGTAPGAQSIWQNLAGTALNGPVLPDQLKRGPVSYPMPGGMGRFSQLAAQMAGPTGGVQTPQRAPIQPPQQGLPMIDPSILLQLLHGGLGGF